MVRIAFVSSKYPRGELIELKNFNNNSFGKNSKFYRLQIEGNTKLVNWKRLKNFFELETLTIISSYPVDIIEQLVNLQKLIFLRINCPCNMILNNLSIINNFAGIEKLLSLEILSINTNKFPHEVIQLKKLTKLKIITNDEITIPNEICQMDNLFEFEIYPKKKNYLSDSCFIFGDKMIIGDWNQITSNLIKHINFIKDIKIINVSDYGLNNLPANIEILRLNLINNENRKIFDNLPITLKKIYIYSYSSTQEKFSNIKLPFGCELFLVIKKNIHGSVRVG